jgi:hypothetical protein
VPQAGLNHGVIVFGQCLGKLGELFPALTPPQVSVVFVVDLDRN